MICRDCCGSGDDDVYGGRCRTCGGIGSIRFSEPRYKMPAAPDQGDGKKVIGTTEHWQHHHRITLPVYEELPDF